MRVRNVDVGQVTQITLSDNFEAAELHIEMNAGTGDYVSRGLAVLGGQTAYGRRYLWPTPCCRALMSARTGRVCSRAISLPRLSNRQSRCDTDGKRIVWKVIERQYCGGDSVQYRGVTVGIVEQVTSRSRREQRPTMCS